MGVAFGVALDICQVYSDPDGGTDAVFHSLPILFCPLQIHVDLMIDTSVLTFFDPDEGHLPALHSLETRPQVLKRSFIVHHKIVSDFSFLIEIYELAIIEPCLVFVLNCVSVFRERPLSLDLCQNFHRPVTINVLLSDWIYRLKVEKFIEWPSRSCRYRRVGNWRRISYPPWS